MKRVLIVSYYFPPINMMAAKRYGTMCRYFDKHGYKPYVLTTKCGRLGWVDVRMELECPVGEDQVVRIGRADKNGEVRNVCGAYMLRLLKKMRYESRTVNNGSLGWYEKVKENMDLERFRGIDLIVGTFPPMENLFAACYLARKLQVPYIADIRDLISDYTESENDDKPAGKLDSMVERYVLSRAAGIVTVTPGFKNILKKRFPGQRFKVVFNGWDKEGRDERDLADLCRCGPGGSQDSYLYYAGSLYLHRLESFTLLVRCIKKANEKRQDKLRFIVRSIGPKDLDARAKSIVRQEGMQEYVTILEAASEGTVRAEQKRAFMNVVLSSIHADDKALMTTVPGKVYELMRESAPVLAVVPEVSDVGKVLKYTNKGIASVDGEEIAACLMEEHKKYTGNKKVLYFSREKQAERLCSFFDEVLDS